MTALLPRDELRTALKQASAVIPKRLIVPILGSARIELSADGCSISSSNLDCWLTQPIAAKGPPWCGCIDLHQTLGFIESLPKGGEVELVVGDGESVSLVAAGTRMTLVSLAAADFPLVRQLPDDQTVSKSIAGSALVEALKFCVPAARDGGNRRLPPGVYLDPGGQAVATDGYRLASHRLATGLPGCILPLPLAELLPKLLKGFAEDVTVEVSPRLARFAGSGWTLTSKVLEGEFLDWRRLIPKPSESPLIVATSPLAMAVGRVDILGDRTSGARLELRDGKLTVAAASAGNAEVITTLAVEAGPESAKVVLAPRYLGDAIDALASNEWLEMHIGDALDPVWLCGMERETGVLIVPMRW